MTDQLDLVKIRLSIPSDVVIITHRNPDGDALGSSLALAAYLRKKMHSVIVISPSDYPSAFHYLHGIDDVMIYDIEHEAAIEKIQKADMICCLDFNALDRIDKLGPEIAASKAFKVLIDHHIDPEPFADFQLSETTASSTCELIYVFIEMLEDLGAIDVNIGECLFTGLITDTGSFHYATNPRAYKIAAHLKELGVDDYLLHDKIFNTKSEKQLRLLGHCIYNRMEILSDYGAGIITLTKQDYEDYKIERGDTEGIVNYLLSLKGISIAAFITEQPSIVKVSLRSKGDFSVQEIASNHFNGGGHKNASGGSAYATLDAVVSRFKKVLPQYVNKSMSLS